MKPVLHCISQGYRFSTEVASAAERCSAATEQTYSGADVGDAGHGAVGVARLDAAARKSKSAERMSCSSGVGDGGGTFE